MNTYQLYNVLSKNDKTKKNFKGVFPSDDLPAKKLRKPAFVVANTDDRYSPGEHWICFYFPKQKGSPGYYFDSISVGPLNEHFIKFLKTNCKRIYSNK